MFSLAAILWETEIKGGGLITIVEEMSRQSNIQPEE